MSRSNPAKDIDFKIAASLSSFCVKSYLGFEAITQFAHDQDFERTWEITVEKLQAYVVARDEAVIVICRGTDEYPDWKVNVKFQSTDHGEKGRVHAGYDWASNAIYERLKEILPTFPNTMNFYFTGHSLGGALAALMALKFYESTQIYLAGVWLFAAPPVGDLKHARRMKSLIGNVTYLVVSCGDIVSRILPRPLGELFGGIYQVIPGKMLWIDTLERLWINPVMRRRIWGFAIAWLQHFGRKGFALADHHKMSRYSDIMLDYCIHVPEMGESKKH